MLHITPSQRWEAEWIATRLREVDKQEVYAATGDSPVAVLPLCYDISTECFTIRAQRDGDPIGIFGVGGGGWKPSVGHIGIPWLLATDELVNAQAIPFIRVSRPWVERLGRQFDVLANYVYTENKVHIRWLTWAGFAIGTRPMKHGPLGAPFFPFAKRTSNNHV